MDLACVVIHIYYYYLLYTFIYELMLLSFLGLSLRLFPNTDMQMMPIFQKCFDTVERR